MKNAKQPNVNFRNVQLKELTSQLAQEGFRKSYRKEFIDLYDSNDFRPCPEIHLKLASVLREYLADRNWEIENEDLCSLSILVVACAKAEEAVKADYIDFCKSRCFNLINQAAENVGYNLIVRETHCNSAICSLEFYRKTDLILFFV